MSTSIRNLLSHIENGQKNRILVIEHIKSKAAIATLNVLQQNGYIRGYRFNQLKPTKIDILLKYKNQEPAINKIFIPIKKVYIKRTDAPLQGTLILSTSKGVVSDAVAYKLNVGGVLMCKILSHRPEHN